MSVTIRPVELSDAHEFLAAVRASRALHKPWVKPPATAKEFAAYLARFTAPTSFGFVVIAPGSRQLAGAINITNIIHGAFCSGYLGYFAFTGHEGKGCMAQGLRAVVRLAFTRLGLHRLEANIQPGNAASIALVKACGFHKEGFSPSYLKIRGRWRDHERWAILRQ